MSQQHVEWYYAKDNRQMGPVSALELKRLATFDELRPDDLVWREGMTEWAAARNVRGLFDQEAATLAAAAPAAPSAVSPKAVAVAAKPENPVAKRHLFDAVIDGARPHFNPHFVEATAGIFRACGSYCLPLAAILVVVFSAIATTKTSVLHHVLWGVVSMLLLLVLQYVAGKSLAAIDELNRTTSGRLASSLVPDAVATLSLVAGIAALLGSIATAIETSNYLLILGGVAGFFVCAYLSVIALHPSILHIAIAPEILTGEEWIGVVTFLLKAILRMTPVAFGAGVVCGGAAIAVQCFLIVTANEAGCVQTMEAARTAQRVLFYAAALPLVAYLVFVAMNLVLNLWRAILCLPGKLDILAENAEAIVHGQPDTVTTHD